MSDSWTTKAPMPTPREHFGTAVLNGLLYVAGGNSNFGSNNFEVYQP